MAHNVIMTFQNGNQFTGKGQDEIGPFIFTNGKISGKMSHKMYWLSVADKQRLVLR